MGLFIKQQPLKQYFSLWQGRDYRGGCYIRPSNLGCVGGTMWVSSPVKRMGGMVEAGLPPMDRNSTLSAYGVK